MRYKEGCCGNIRSSPLFLHHLSDMRNMGQDKEEIYETRG